MALDRQIARLAKILVDSEQVSFDEAQARLRALTLEIVVGPEATSPASHAAILTAVSVASRTFVGGVRVTGAVDGRLNSALPLRADSLAEAAALVGASDFDSVPSRTVFVGMSDAPTAAWGVSPWWNGWKAGTAKPGEARWDEGRNPLPGIAAGALAVGAAFEAERKEFVEFYGEVDLWPWAQTGKRPDSRRCSCPGCSGWSAWATWDRHFLGARGAAFRGSWQGLPRPSGPGYGHGRELGHLGLGEGRDLWVVEDKDRRTLGGCEGLRCQEDRSASLRA